MGAEQQQQHKPQLKSNNITICDKRIECLPRFANMTEQYDKAIEALNGQLQTNFAVLEQVKKERREMAHIKLQRTVAFLDQAGMTLDDVDGLPIVHVSGTKGKGSTCAFCESILRHRGLKTGLFTSPHLLSVTERIRINGEPIGKALFAHYFWKVYDKIVTANPLQERPNYFQFLTVLAYYIFWKEGVDVAIMEVGVGGRFDSTNVVRKPVVCGITTLDLDHTSILGNTIGEIAWQKAGIMKQGVPTYVDGTQPENAMEVLASEAEKVGSSLVEIPDLSSYDWGSFPPQSLGMFGEVYHRNASVALQISRYFYDNFYSAKGKQQQNMGKAAAAVASSASAAAGEAFKLDLKEALGLKLCRWPGRAQVISKEFRGKKGRLVYFLDGAHTKLSMESCVQWFKTVSDSKHHADGLSRDKIFKVLIFNLTKDDRKARPLLQMLSESCDFDVAFFTPNVVRPANDDEKENADNVNNCVSLQGQIDRRDSLSSLWSELTRTKCPSVKVDAINDAVDGVLKMAMARSSAAAAVGDNSDQGEQQVEQVQVLITGSLLLLGNTLQIIDPHTTFKPDPEEERRITEMYVQMSDANGGTYTTCSNDIVR